MDSNKGFARPHGDGMVLPDSRQAMAGLSLIELLVAFVIFAGLMVILVGAVEPVSRTWIESERKVLTYQRARGALELLTRELTPAVVDTRMQFAVIPGNMLGDIGAPSVVEESPVLLWMAPLGRYGDLRCVGYYLFRDEDRQLFRLKRIFVKPFVNDKKENPYFPAVGNSENIEDLERESLNMRTSPVEPNWYLDRWNDAAFDEEDTFNRDAIVSTAADGVLAFWIQCYDLLGNPIPWLSEVKNHPASEMIFNSAGYFHQANVEPFEGGATTVFLRETKYAMKANRLPAEIEITIVTVDDDVALQGLEIPPMSSVLFPDGSLDLETSVELFEDALNLNGIQRSRTFSTRVKLLGGS
jgi:hypothetical protein